MDDAILEDEDISWKVRRLCLKRSDRPSGMLAEHLHQWLIAATRDDSPDANNLQKVVDIVQSAFCDERLAE